MNSSEIDSYTVMSRSHYNESLSHNNKLSTKHEILSFSDETAAKEDTEKVYASYCYYINLYLNEKNQIWLHKKTLLKELTEMSIASL